MTAITTFKVIQGHHFVRTSRKLVCDFLLVSNTNLMPSYYTVSKLLRIYSSNFCLRQREIHFF